MAINVQKGWSVTLAVRTVSYGPVINQSELAYYVSHIINIDIDSIFYFHIGRVAQTS